MDVAFTMKSQTKTKTKNDESYESTNEAVIEALLRMLECWAVNRIE